MHGERERERERERGFIHLGHEGMLVDVLPLHSRLDYNYYAYAISVTVSMTMSK